MGTAWALEGTVAPRTAQPRPPGRDSGSSLWDPRLLTCCWVCGSWFRSSKNLLLYPVTFTAFIQPSSGIISGIKYLLNSHCISRTYRTCWGAWTRDKLNMIDCSFLKCYTQDWSNASDDFGPVQSSAGPLIWPYTWRQTKVAIDLGSYLLNVRSCITTEKTLLAMTFLERSVSFFKSDSEAVQRYF